MNTDSNLRPEIGEDEKKLLDEVLLSFKADRQKSKNLVNAYLATIIKPQKHRDFVQRKVKQIKLPNRKQIEKRYANFQRLYKKKKKDLSMLLLQ